MDHDHGHGNRRRGLPLSELDPALTEKSRLVIGGAIEVHKALGPGFSRDIYLNALKIELDAAGLEYEVDTEFEVVYKDQDLGGVSIDIFVEERFAVELLARPGQIGSLERLALRSKLRAADVELGLIINFSERRLKDGLVRVLNPDKLNLTRPEDEHEDEYEESSDE
ncbi:MAG TPA: GxxExxY protein [Phycisphaerales bacterium]|nr:GxxExxY protein [Phycisphaerales bacterium]